MNKMKGQELQITLPRRDQNLIQLSIFSISFLISFTYVIWSFWRLRFNIFYSQIIDVSLFTILSFMLLISGYGLIDALYQQPILVLTANNIFIGTKRFLRPSRLQNSGLSPHNDMRLIIVKESSTQRLWLMLEEKKIIDLGIFTTIEKAEKLRHQLKRIMSKYYPNVFISSPIYREV